jgi:uncharacterized damage-inducible protein DinB
MFQAAAAAAVPAAAIPAAAAASAWTNPFAKSWRDSFAKHWSVTKDYTLAILDQMPAEHFDFKATPAQRTFGEQMVHLAVANAAYMTAFNAKTAPARTENTSDKAAVRAYVAASFDYVTDVLNMISENDLVRSDLKFNARNKPHSGTDLFMRAYMHTAHHRGQLITYLRMKEIVPATWAFEPTV